MIVELLPLERDELLVNVDMTDNSDGLDFNRASTFLCSPLPRCFTGRRWLKPASSLRLDLVADRWRRRRLSEPVVLAFELMADSLTCTILLRLGKNRPSSRSIAPLGGLLRLPDFVSLPSDCRDDRLLERLLFGESSTSSQSTRSEHVSKFRTERFTGRRRCEVEP